MMASRLIAAAGRLNGFPLPIRGHVRQNVRRLIAIRTFQRMEPEVSPPDYPASESSSCGSPGAVIQLSTKGPTE